MKKRIILVSAITCVAVGALFSGCFKDSIENGCRCIAKNTQTKESATQNYSYDEVAAVNKNSCSAFAKYQDENDGTDKVTWTCYGR